MINLAFSYEQAFKMVPFIETLEKEHGCQGPKKRE